MRYSYFQKIEQAPSSIFGMLVLALMLLLLILTPHIAFAALDDDPMPRYILSPDDIAETVSKTLEEQGYGDSIEASVQVDEANTIYGSDEPMEIMIKTLNADKQKRRWSANVIFVNGEKVLTAMPMQGKFDEMVELPVLDRSLKSGQEITADHLIYKNFPIHYLRAGVIRDSSELIGKSAKRTISIDRPIRDHEVSTPMIVKKNDLVTLNYIHGNLTITTNGQVMADAAIGDVIQVKNLNSDKKVRAIIKNASTANVLPLIQTSAKLGTVHEAR